MFTALRGAMGIPVTYTRGGDSVQVTATPGQTSFEIDDGSGLLIESSASDWIIAVDALILAGVKATPKRGDRITRTLNGKTLIYEIMGFGGEKAARTSDNHGHAWRVHSRLIEEFT